MLLRGLFFLCIANR